METLHSGMNNWSRILLLICLLLAAAHSDAQSSAMEINIEADERSYVGYQYRTHKNIWGECINYPFEVRVSQEPRFGKVELINSTMTLENKRNVTIEGSSTTVSSTMECAGATVPCVQLYYTPNPGFRGVDVIKVEVITDVYPPGEFLRIVYVGLK
jgi:hypothetical protein